MTTILISNNSGGNSSTRCPSLVRYPAYLGLILIVLFASQHLRAQLAEAPVAAIPIDRLTTMSLRDPARFHVTADAVDYRSLALDRFEPLTDDDINRGISARHHWVRVRLDNSLGEQPVRWVIHHETTYLDELSSYISDNGGPVAVAHITDRAPFSSRPIDYRALAFEHTTPAGGYSDVLMRLSFARADAMSLNLQLSRAELFYNGSRAGYLGHGIYFGVLISLLVVTLILAINLRQKVYLVYSSYLALNLVM